MEDREDSEGKVRAANLITGTWVRRKEVRREGNFCFSQIVADNFIFNKIVSPNKHPSWQNYVQNNENRAIV